MQQRKAEELINKYLQGSSSPEEKAWVETWYLKYDQAEHTFSAEELTEDKAKSLQELLVLTRSRKQASLRYIISAAAAVIALAIFGLYFFKTPLLLKNETTRNILDNDIAPGKQGATLTLANGKKIKLSDAINGELAKEAGVTITKSADGQLIYEVAGSKAEPNKINTLSTARGETYQVRLPDGSRVWLNATSALSYPASFAGTKKRVVKLSGEAYFEIFENKKQPFIVESNGQQVEVLGTHFNINSYADEIGTKTTLLEGSVRIAAKNKVQTLKPGQQSLLSGNEIEIFPANIEEIMAWKEGYFSFDNADIKSVMKQLSRWYDVEVVFNGRMPGDHFTGKVPRDMNLSKVLEVLSFAEVNFKIEGRKMTILSK